MPTASRPSRSSRSAPLARTGHKAPEGYTLSDYPVFAVTVDVVILTMVGSEAMVLLVQRAADPYAGRWALPGGFKHVDETLDQAAARELSEETGFRSPRRLEQFGAYGDPGRDPRANVVTVAYLAVVDEVNDISPGTDAVGAALLPLHDVLDKRPSLAFDHRRILRDAAAHVAERIESTDLAPAFVPERFTLTQLREVYEQFWDETLEPANFRRSLLKPTSPYVEPTEDISAPSDLGGRPAQMFRATSAWQTAGPPVRRTRKTRPPR